MDTTRKNNLLELCVPKRAQPHVKSQSQRPRIDFFSIGFNSKSFSLQRLSSMGTHAHPSVYSYIRLNGTSVLSSFWEILSRLVDHPRRPPTGVQSEEPVRGCETPAPASPRRLASESLRVSLRGESRFAASLDNKTEFFSGNPGFSSG
jgi:hypothetical protein